MSRLAAGSKTTGLPTTGLALERQKFHAPVKVPWLSNRRKKFQVIDESANCYA